MAGRWQGGTRAYAHDAARVGAACCSALLCAVLILLGGCAPGQAPAPTGQGAAGGAGKLAADTTTLATSTTLTYVALGASDAFGIGASDPIHRNWPALLASRLANQRGVSVHLVNLGIPGATSVQALQDELPVAETVSPDIITILLGTNDIINQVDLGDSEGALGSMVQTLRSSDPRAIVLVGNVPDLTRLPYFADDDLVALQDEIDALNAYITVLCARTGATLVDVYGATASQVARIDIGADGLHPSDAGAQALALLFASALPAPSAASTPTLTPSPTGATGEEAP